MATFYQLFQKILTQLLWRVCVKALQRWHSREMCDIKWILFDYIKFNGVGTGNCVTLTLDVLP